MSAQALLLCLLGLPAAAQATQASAGICQGGAGEAETRALRGYSLRKEGRLKESLVELRCAVELQASPRNLAQLATAEQEAELWVDAERHLEAALAARADPWIKQYLDPLLAARSDIQQHIGELMLEGAQPAQVVLDGHVVATLPLGAPLRAPTGKRRLEVKAPGFRLFSMDVDVGANARLVVKIVLDPEPIAATTTPFRIEDERGAWRRTAGWTALAAAGATLGVSIAFHLHRESLADKFNAMGSGCGELVINRGAPGCRKSYDDIMLSQGVAIGGYVTSALLSGLGGYLLATAPSQPAVALLPDGGVRLDFQGRF